MSMQEQLNVEGCVKEKWWLSYIKENLLSATWTAILVCGGLILLAYHLGIGYLPDFELGSSVGVFASAALIGLVFVFVFVSYALFPGIFFLWADGVSETKFSKKSNRTIKSKSEVYSDLTLFLLPLLLLSFIYASSAFGVYEWMVTSFAILTVVFLVFLCRWIYLGLVKSKINSAMRIGEPLKGVAFIVFRHIFWNILLVCPLLYVITVSRAGMRVHLDASIVIGFLSLLICNMVIQNSQKNRFVIAIGFSLATLCIVAVIPVFTGNGLLFPNIIVKSMGIGNVNAQNMTISYKQCVALQPFSDINCADDVNENAQISLQNVNVLSRMGSSVLIELLVEDVRSAQDTVTDSNEKNAANSAKIRGEEKKSVPASSTNHLHLKDSSQISSFFQSKKINVDKASNEEIAHQTCDQIIWENAELPYFANRQSPKDMIDSELNKYKRSLICHRISIPKDQVTSFSLGDRRAYRGFTNVVIPKSATMSGKTTS
jgi:hypothetical protein